MRTCGDIMGCYVNSIGSYSGTYLCQIGLYVSKIIYILVWVYVLETLSIIMLASNMGFDLHG